MYCKAIVATTALVAFLGSAYADPVDVINDKFLVAIATIESGGNPNAESSCGARGIYQIMEATWNEHSNGVPWGEAFNAEANRKVAIVYLKWLQRTLRKWMGREPGYADILAAYNGGIGRYRRNNFDLSKMPRETRNYVVKFRKEYNNGR